MNDTTRRRKRATVAAAAAVSAAAAPAILAAPATANHPKATCPGNVICEWEDGGFQTPVMWWSPTSTDLDYRNNQFASQPSEGLNDRISALWNNTNRWAKFFRNPHGSGATICLSPGGAISDLATVRVTGDEIHDWSNRISGHATSANNPGGCDVTRSTQGCSL
jgi:Peptidase inhibitor family I36